MLRLLRYLYIETMMQQSGEHVHGKQLILSLAFCCTTVLHVSMDQEQ